MGVLDSVKKGFSVAKASMNLIIVLFAFSFVWSLLNIPFQGEEISTSASALLLILGIAFILVSIFMQAGSLGYIHEAIKSGQSNLTTFKASGGKFFLRILGVGLVVALFIIALTIIALIIALIGGGQPNAVTVILGLLLAVIGLIGIFLLFMSPYMIVVDDAKVFDAIKGSIEFVKANIIKILGIGLLLILIGFAVGLILGTIIAFLSGILGNTANQVISGFLSSAVNAYLGVVTTAAFMTFYTSSKG